MDHHLELSTDFFRCGPYNDEICGSAGMVEVSTPRMVEISSPRVDESLSMKRGNTPPPPYENPPSYDVAVQMEIEMTNTKSCMKVQEYTKQFL